MNKNLMGSWPVRIGLAGVVALVTAILTILTILGTGHGGTPQVQPSTTEYEVRACTPARTQCEVIHWTTTGTELKGKSWVEVQSSRTNRWVPEGRTYELTGTQQNGAITATGVADDDQWDISGDLRGRTLHLRNGGGHVSESDLNLVTGYPKSAR